MKNKNINIALEGRFIDPEMVINQLAVKEGQVVADFGCGAGYFAIPMAKIVGKEGKVYAFDIMQAQLDATSGRVKMFSLENVVIKRVNLEMEGGSGLEDDSVDWVIIKDILSQNQNKNIIIQEAKRVLKVGGKMIFIEWNANQSVGPKANFRLNQEELKKMVQSNQLAIKQSLAAGDFHYAFLAEKV